MASKGARFKALLHAPEILIMPGVYDGYTARLAEASGFKAASISGAGVWESRLGWVDRGIIGFDELNDLMGMKQVDELERRFVGG